ncbi:MAG: hypothetical protein RB296_06305 [Acidobacteriota bacterium]|jgi:hypothetical protein|nr:hypothetical protein [Acidobacteriota bacterium]
MPLYNNVEKINEKLRELEKMMEAKKLNIVRIFCFSLSYYDSSIRFNPDIPGHIFSRAALRR